MGALLARGRSCERNDYNNKATTDFAGLCVCVCLWRCVCARAVDVATGDRYTFAGASLGTALGSLAAAILQEGLDEVSE